MRWQYPLAGILVLTGAPFAMAQETPSLCNPCVDPPLWNGRPGGGFRSPSPAVPLRNATTIITAEDMRSLGVVSVADMIAQLPSTLANPVAQEPEGPAEGEATEAGNDTADAEPDEDSAIE